VPLYEYRCKKCGHAFEQIQKFSDPLVADCPHCKAKGTVEQLMSRSSVRFKGSGWYATDYAKKPISTPAKSGDSKTGESKTEVKAGSGSEKSEKKAETKKSESSEKHSDSGKKKE
jgi:putative FmdB family regulatory protein